MDNLGKIQQLGKLFSAFPLAGEIRRQERITVRLLELANRTKRDMAQLLDELKKRTIESPLRAEDVLEIMYEEYTSEQLTLQIENGALVAPGEESDE